MENFVNEHFMMLIKTTHEYNPEDYSDQVVSEITQTSFHDMKGVDETKTELFTVRQNKVESTQDFFRPLYERETTFYSVEQEADHKPFYRIPGTDYTVIMQMTFLMDLDVIEYSRTIYSILDFLGDVGGFSDAIFYLGGLLIWIIQGNKFA